MFDAKSMLEALMRGGAQQDQQLSLGLQSTNQLGKQSSPGALREGVPQSAGALEDMLRKVTVSGQSSLNDILAKLQQQGGNLPEILGQVLGQATSGVREGAAQIDDATGASRYARDAIGKATGRSPEELLAQLKKLIADNQVGAGAALAGLSALLLATSAGRSLAGSAAKVGSLALIGGLAYKAYQNFQQGKPVLTGQQPPQQALLAAPTGSGFEAGAVTDESAMLLMRAMIAAAAADGRIDEKEQQRILGGLKQAGLDGTAQQFLAREINHPATADDLAKAISSPVQAVQVYTAARIAVDPDAEEEHDFLAALADRLGIDQNLANHIDAVARNTNP